jgi:hypothetical protein
MGGWAETPQRGQFDPCAAMGDAAAWTPTGVVLAQPATFEAPRSPTEEIDGEVRGVNQAGNMVGRGREYVPSAQPPTCIDKVLFWVGTSSTGIELPAPDETRETLGDAVGVAGDQVVGSNVSDSRAILWLNDGGTWSYNELDDHWSGPGDWMLKSAVDINVFGLICGVGNNDPGYFTAPEEAFVLIPDPCTCTGDQNGDGQVGVNDLVLMLTSWGCTDPPGPCPADLNGDGVVNVNDLVILLVAWGNCGCNIFDPAPPSLSQALAEAGLPPGAWDEFMANIDDPNYRCWMAYHLLGGTPNCPGPDPWAP